MHGEFEVGLVKTEMALLQLQIVLSTVDALSRSNIGPLDICGDAALMLLGSQSAETTDRGLVQSNDCDWAESMGC